MDGFGKGRVVLRPLSVGSLEISVTDSLGFPLYSEENGQHGKGVVFNSYIGNPGTAAKYTNKDAKIEVTLGRDEAKKNAGRISLYPDSQFRREERIGSTQPDYKPIKFKTFLESARALNRFKLFPLNDGTRILIVAGPKSEIIIDHRLAISFDANNITTALMNTWPLYTNSKSSIELFQE